MKKEGRKMTWAIGLIAGLGVLSIAYAALSSTLQINGDTTKINTHGVEFLKSSDGYAIGDDTKIDEGGNVTPAITDKSKFNEAPANALAKLGTCEIGTLSESDLNGLATNGTAGVNRVRNNDKMTIKGTELYEWGSYVVYKLDLQNFASNNMKLTSAPEVEVTASDSTIKDRVEVKLYSDSTCKTELAAWQDGDATTGNDKGNWLAKATTADAGGAKTDGGTTSWYVKVYYNQYSKGASPAWELKDGTFTFTVAPVWEAA